MAGAGPATGTSGVVKGACPHDCPDACAWEVTVENGVAVRLAGSRTHPVTRGVLCAKVNWYLDRVYSPERVLRPLRRAGPKGAGAFQPVSWDEALGEIAARLAAVVARDGGEAVLPYSFAGNQGLVQYGSMDRRFFARLGASRLARTICGSTAGAGVTATLGTSVGILPEDVVHSRFIVLWGTNTVVTNVHLWPFVRRAREAGARLVVIDPLRTRTAAEADWHVRPLPGADAALALGMMHVIVAEGLHDADYLARYTVGFEPLRERLREYSPERAAALCGVEAGEIVRLARAYALTRPAVIRTLVGPEKHPGGGMLLRTLACLPALVGAWRDRGGGLLTWTLELHLRALDTDAVERPGLAAGRTRTINMVQLGRALTDPALRPPVRALFVYNSNPAVTTPNQPLVRRGLAREDLFTVVHDLFVTDTARFADFVLPAASFVEAWDLVTSWGHQYLALNRPAIAPRGEAVSNSELFRRLARAMGFDEPWVRESDEELIRAALGRDHPWLQGVTFERLLAEGWAPLGLPADWRPFAAGGFPTPSGKCELYAERLAARGLDPLPGYEPPAGDGEPLVLISSKAALHFLNSSYAHLPRHRGAEGEPVLDLHPADAAPRGIADGDRVRVFNRQGAVTLRVRVGDRVRPGVVAMPHGWGPAHTPTGATANALTGDGLADLGGGGDFYSTRVEVSRA
jgi:anaerobic selenocysteine-containing dehydrogenase